MRIKRTLFVFALGIAVGSAGTWFLMQEPEKRDQIIEKARESISEAAGAISERTGEPISLARAFVPPGNIGFLSVGLEIGMYFHSDYNLPE